MAPKASYFADMKLRGEKIVVVTAYDAPTAQALAEVGVDIILVGDSVGVNVLGYAHEREVTLADIEHFAQFTGDNFYAHVDEEAVTAELLWARRVCNAQGWPTIDVTRRSIEETAATVLQLMEAWHERQRKLVAASTPGLPNPGPPNAAS